MTHPRLEPVLISTNCNHMDQPPIEDDETAELNQPTGEDALRDEIDRTTMASDEEQIAGPPRPTLERIPAELRIRILSSIPDLLTLDALIHASPVYFAQYQLNCRPILFQVLQTDLGEELLIDVYGTFMSRPTETQQRKGPSSNVSDFLRQYHRCRSPGAERPTLDMFSLDDLRWMTWFHLTIVRPLAARFVASALHVLRSTSARPAESDLRDPGQHEFSRTEKTRLLRAFYRFQIFCHLFGGSQYEPSGFRYSDISRLFFSELEPWEIEEIGCIYTFARGFYAEVYAEVNWDFDERNPKFADVGPPFEPGIVFDINGHYYEGFRDGTIGQGGLKLVYDMIRTEDHDELVDLMGRSFKELGGDFFGQAADETSQSEMREDPLNDRNRAEERREALEFAGDDSARPSLAWVLLWDGKYSNLYGAYVPDKLRSWGYVIWDARRLDVKTAKKYFSALWDESPELKMVKEDWPWMQDVFAGS